MGEDWIQKTERMYKHSQRRKAKQLTPSSMFGAKEVETTSYPCQLVNPEQKIPFGTKMTIFQRSEGAKIAVLIGTQVVATVEGEPAHDLRRAFSQHPAKPRVLDVECVSSSEGAPWVEVSPSMSNRRKAKKQ
jgi:hypothetical protein